ncbi:Predicted membrane protein (plasmid) [Legionella adelaidensis]|uniref:Predicted membrane protein n=1 Tax=Legionella adelaidensis TaxID=45056 RepID=A0A0W0R063_9GAMM|nr:hypothetical protein [Legionella adelaidensis]KTC64476.1 hypothetical protein Lade_1770 [Legionella adelaidensis]VEH85844.1 Predicted membrane protein [Legionella adelaidensis]
MLLIKNIRHSFWKVDPGSLELLNAVKTVLAIIISLLLLQNQSFITQIMAGVASAFSMQGVVAKTWQTRIKHVVIFDGIYFGVFCLGLLVRDSSYLTAILLVVVGFFANYIRRFNLETSMAPMSAWTLCFLATILPFHSITEAWVNIYGLLVGFVVSALIIIFVYPENYPRSFVNNSNRFFDALAEGIFELRRYMVQPKPDDNVDFLEIKKVLIQLANSNQLIHQSNVLAKYEEKILEQLIHQYALLSSFNMMIDAYQTIKQNNFSLPTSLILQLMQYHKKFCFILKRLVMDSNFEVFELEPIDFSQLNIRLENIPTSPTHLVMTLLNLKLSFDLLEKHLKSLVWGIDGT